MNPIRRELINGLLVLVVASLLSVAFSAFQVTFNATLWVLILMGIAIAVSGYILFEINLGVITSAEDREKALAESMRQREEEWLKRVGTPARLDLRFSGRTGLDMSPFIEAVKSMRPGADLTIMMYHPPEGAPVERIEDMGEGLRQFYGAIEERLKHGSLRGYKRLLCFDHDVLETHQELKSGIVRVGEGPGTIGRRMAQHYRFMMETKGCSLYVAPTVLQGIINLFGTDKASMSLLTADQQTGARTNAGVIFFHDPPNGEIIEQLRQIVREGERRMVAVHKIVFPEDEPSAVAATR